MLKQTWGENLIGNLGIGLVFLLAYLALLAMGNGLVYTGIARGLPMLIATTFVLGVVRLVLLGTLQAALQGVYSAALYRFAAGDAIAVPGFGPDLMRLAFRPK